MPPGRCSETPFGARIPAAQCLAAGCKTQDDFGRCRTRCLEGASEAGPLHGGDATGLTMCLLFFSSGLRWHALARYGDAAPQRCRICTRFSVASALTFNLSVAYHASFVPDHVFYVRIDEYSTIVQKPKAGEP